MRHPGQIVLFPFPHTDQTKAKLRPALLIAKTPDENDDWLLCMISAQLHHEVPGFDEIIRESDADGPDSGLKKTSLIRLGRLAVVDGGILLGSIGSVSAARLKIVRDKIADWIGQKTEASKLEKEGA